MNFAMNFRTSQQSSRNIAVKSYLKLQSLIVLGWYLPGNLYTSQSPFVISKAMRRQTCFPDVEAMLATSNSAEASPTFGHANFSVFIDRMRSTNYQFLKK